MKGYVAPAIVGVVAVVLGALVGVGGITAAGAFMGLLLFVLAFAFPTAAIPVAVFAAVLQYLPTRAFAVLPQPAVLIDDVIVMGIVVRLLADMALSRVRPKWWLVAPVAAFMLVALVGALANRTELSVGVNALRALVLPIGLMPAAAVYLNSKQSRSRAVSVILVLTLLNAVVSFGQWLTNPASPDVATGLLGPGGANGSGFLSLLGLVLALVSAWPIRWRWTAVAVLSAGLLVSSARAAIVAAPAAVLVSGWRSAGVTRARRAASVMLVVALTFGLGYYYQAAGRSLEQDISPTALITGQQVAGQGGRLLYLVAVPAVWRSVDLSAIWGVGPGGYTSFVGMNRLAPAFVAQARVRTDSLIGFAYPDMQWTALLGEYGLLGTALAVLAFALPVAKLRGYFRKPLSGTDSSLLTAMPAIAVLWFAGMAAVNLMEYVPVAVPLWVVAGAAAAAAAEYEDEVEA